MIEVYPQEVREERLHANLDKLVAAFLMAAEDLASEEDEEPPAAPRLLAPDQRPSRH